MPGDTRSGLADMDSKLKQQKQQTREKNRKRAEEYRLRKRQEEQNLRTKYQLVIRQNIGLIAEIQRLKMICQQLTTTLTQHQSNSKMGRAEYRNTNIEEEDEGELVIDMSMNNGAPIVLQEDSQTFRDKINYQEINCEGISMCAEDWVTWLGT